jgi:hypothetical protein
MKDYIKKTLQKYITDPAKYREEVEVSKALLTKEQADAFEIVASEVNTILYSASNVLGESFYQSYVSLKTTNNSLSSFKSFMN